MNWGKRIVKILAWGFGIIIMLELFWCIGANAVLNKYVSGEFIENYLKNKKNAAANIENLKFIAKPDFSLSISADKIKITKDGTNITDTENFKMSVKVLPAILNCLYIDNLSSEKTELNLIREKDGTINLISIIPEFILKMPKPDIKKLKTDIRNYKISFTDRGTGTTTQLSGPTILIKNYADDKELSFFADGNIVSDGTSTPFYFELNTKLPFTKNLSDKNFYMKFVLANFNLSALTSFTKYINADKIEKLDGTVSLDIKTLTLQNKNYITGDILTKNIYIKEDLPENDTFFLEPTKIKLSAMPAENDLYIETLKLQNPNHKLNLKGSIKNITANKPKLDLTLSLHNDTKSMIYNAVPSEFEFENRMIAKIKKYKPKATVDGSITIKGDINKPDIEGEFHSDNLFIDMPDTKAAKATIKLVFLKDKLRVTSHVIPHKDTFVDVDGLCDLYGEKRAVFDIKSGKNVDLKLTRAVLMPIQDTFSLNFSVLNQIYAQKGQGDAVFHIDGTKELAKIDGRLNFYNGHANFDGINTFVDDINGYVNFNKYKVDFATSSSTVNGDKITIRGDADVFGKYNIYITSNSIKTQSLTNIFFTSPLLEPISKDYKDLNQIENILGMSDFTVHISGKTDIKNPLINFDKADYKGTLKLNQNKLTVKNIETPVNLSSANISFDKDKIDAAVNAKLKNSSININADLNKNNVKIYSTSNNVELGDIILLADKKLYKKLVNGANIGSLKYEALYQAADKKEFKPQNLKLNAALFEPKNTNSGLKVNTGNIDISNGNAEIKNIQIKLFDSSIYLDGIIRGFAAKKPNPNIKITLKNFKLDTLNNYEKFKLQNTSFNKIITAYENYKGTISGQLFWKNSGLEGYVNILNTGFTHKKTKMPIAVENANIKFRNNNILLQSLNATIDNVPLFANINIKNPAKNPHINGYITTNIYPGFVNSFVNPNLGYPVKLKGELRVKTNFDWEENNLNAAALLSLPIGSDISYMGASLGEEDVARGFNLKFSQKNNKFIIKNATYEKYIPALNGKSTKYPYFTVSGNISDQNIPVLENLNIKTLTKTGSNIFNILFKKSVIKSGNFECDLTLNGKITEPKILGFAKFENLNMPLYETTIKNIYTDFKKGIIEIKTLANIYNTDIAAMIKLDNKLSAPYKIRKLNIEADYINLDKAFDSLTRVTVQAPHNIKTNDNSELFELINPKDIITDNGYIYAKEIQIKGFPARDLNIEFNQNADNLLLLENFDFKIADGTISAKGSYNLKTSDIKGDCIAKSIDANRFSQIFLNLKNQIYGNLDGTVKFFTKGSTQTDRIKNLNGDITFEINNGKMPKLGSLEYLLRAGNIIKSGITGFTINNIIDLLSPVKTGEFSSIQGNITVNKGKADNITIYTKGKNLSLYLKGEADIIAQNATMTIYGRLSKKISTLLGPIGNTSINTLFSLIPGIKMSESENIIKELDKIPLLEIVNDDYRFFKVDINGDINGENYVQSFKWLE